MDSRGVCDASGVWWESLAWAMRVVFAMVFAVAAYGKSADRAGTQDAVAAFGVPDRLVAVAARALPIAEAILAVGLVLPGVGGVAGAAGVVLLCGFTGLVVLRLRRGDRPACACFGEASVTPIGIGTIMRNFVLLVVGASATTGAVIYPRLPVAGLSGERLLVVTGGIVLAGIQVRQGLALRALRTARENDSARMALQLPIGARAPQFELPSTRGTTSLRQLLAAGRPQILVFVHPGCGPCKSIAAHLPALAAEAGEHADVVIIGSGTVEQNALWHTEYGLEHYLVQRSNEIARRYAIDGTPTAIRIAPTGRIDSEPAPGAGGIRRLLRESIPAPTTGSDISN